MFSVVFKRAKVVGGFGVPAQTFLTDAAKVGVWKETLESSHAGV
jgi:hypothetical protein